MANAAEDNGYMKGDIYLCDLGTNPGCIQDGRRPCMVVQADGFNRKSETVLMAPVTSHLKKLYMKTHVGIPMGQTGLDYPSMVMLEQLRTVDRGMIGPRLGTAAGLPEMKDIDAGLRKAFGLYTVRPEPRGEVRCLCAKCAEDYREVPGYIVRRLDPYNGEKDTCQRCGRPGYDYVVADRNVEQA